MIEKATADEYAKIDEAKTEYKEMQKQMNDLQKKIDSVQEKVVACDMVIMELEPQRKQIIEDKKVMELDFEKIAKNPPFI